jgi:hypothetical protein
MSENMNAKSKVRVIDSVWTLIVAIAFIGPFALPLLWRNPRFSRNSKIFWSVVTVLLTVLCLWLMKFTASLTASVVSDAMGAEPCRFERHRPAYPPGERQIRVYAGSDTKFEKFHEAKPFFAYLKQANGKICDVNWTQAKNEIDQWLSTWQSAEEIVGPEITTLIAQQNAPKTVPATAIVTTSAAAPAAAASTPSAKGCETTLLQVRDRLSALKAKSYDSQKVRTAEIDSILRSIEPGPLQ